MDNEVKKANFDYEDLKNLIAKMTKNEKRYFTVNSSVNLRKGNSNFIKMFKLLSSETISPKIESKIQDPSFIKNPAETKYQLFYSVLKNLHNYHIESSVESEVQLLIHYIEICYAKSLYVVAEKLFQRAWEKAHQHEIFTLLMVLLQWKAKLYKTNSKEIGNIIQKEKEILAQLSNLNRYNYIKQMFRERIISYGGRVRNKEEKNELMLFYNQNTWLKDEKNALSFTAVCQHQMINSAYYYCLGDFDKGMEHTKRLLSILKQHPEQRVLSSELYISILQNAIIFSYQLKNFEESKSLIKSLENFKPQQATLEDFKSILLVDNKLILAIRSHKFREAFKNISQYEQVFNNIRKKNMYTPECYSVAYHIAHLYFLNRQYRLALKWTNIILNERSNIRLDIICAAQMLFLITHFELKNDDYIPSAIINTYRLFKKKHFLSKTEGLLLRYLKKMNNLENRREIDEKLFAFKQELQSLYEADPVEKESSLFDYLYWLKTRTTTVRDAG